MCDICCSNDCNCNQILAEKGDPGQPSFLSIPFVVGGVPFVDSSNNFVVAGQFIFSKDIADIFTSVRLNIWRFGGASVNWRITATDTSTGTVNTITSGSATATTTYNVEFKKALQIYNSASAIIRVEVQSVSNIVFIASATFAYDK